MENQKPMEELTQEQMEKAAGGYGEFYTGKLEYVVSKIPSPWTCLPLMDGISGSGRKILKQLRKGDLVETYNDKAAGTDIHGNSVTLRFVGSDGIWGWGQADWMEFVRKLG